MKILSLINHLKCEKIVALQIGKNKFLVLQVRRASEILDNEQESGYLHTDPLKTGKVYKNSLFYFYPY